MMRTTLTLDDDVFTGLKTETASRGTSFRDTVNEVIRDGLRSRADLRKRTPAPPLPKVGLNLRPGLSYDSISTLLAIGEGEDHR